MNQSNTIRHHRGTTTVTQKKSLFESIIAKEVLEAPMPMQAFIPIDIAKQNAQNNITKSLMNLNDIYYQKQFDYDDFKLSLKYNNKKLQKIGLDSIKHIPAKLIKQICKHDLSGLQELKLKDLPLNDESFLPVKENGGLSALFPKLKTVQFSGHDLTSLFVTYCFVDYHQKNRIETLDLSYCKINKDALQHLTEFGWPELHTLRLQWCTKLTDIAYIPQRCTKFPKLNILDLRFTSIVNDSVQKVMSSDLIYNLSTLRVFGSKIRYETNEWHNQWFIGKICNIVSQYKNQSFCFWQVKDEALLLPVEKAYMAKVKEAREDKGQGYVNCQVQVEPDTRVSLTCKWIITMQKAVILLNDSFPTKDGQVKLVQQICEYVGTQQQSLRYLDIFIDNEKLNDNCLRDIAVCITQLKDLTKFSLRFTKQLISTKSFLFLFSSLRVAEHLQYLELKLPCNNIVLDGQFLTSLLNSIQSLAYLNTLFLNFNENTFVHAEVIEFLQRLILNEKGNFWLFHIYVIISTERLINWSLTELMELYLGNPFRSVSINMEESLLPLKYHKTEQKIRKMLTYANNLRKRFLLVLKQLQQCDLGKIMRREMIDSLMCQIYCEV